MSKPNFAGVFRTVKTFATKHSPEILTGLGIAGMVTTTVLAVKATPKAVKLLEAKKKEEKKDKLTPVEVVKTTWKCYLPTVTTCVASTACLIGASKVNFRRNAALATAYKLSETALTEYKDKVVEVVGEKKEREIKEAIAKDKIERQPVTKSEVIITEKGNTLCYDTMFGRYFKSDRDRILKAVNDINRRMRNDNYISLNEFYDELGLDHVGIGDRIGWNIDRGYVEIDFTPHLSDDGTPCLAMTYDRPPQYGFDESY